MDLCDLVDVRGNRFGWLGWVLAVDQHTDCTVFAPCSLWQKGRVEQPSRKWRSRRFGDTKWRVSAVSHQVVHVGYEFTSNTSVGSAYEGLR